MAANFIDEEDEFLSTSFEELYKLLDTDIDIYDDFDDAEEPEEMEETGDTQEETQATVEKVRSLPNMNISQYPNPKV